MEPSSMNNAVGTRPFVAYTVAPQVEQLLEQYLGESAKVLMPEKYRDNFVKGFPWFTLLFMPLHFGLVLMGVGVSALAMFVGHFSWLSMSFSIAILTCNAVALPGLFKRTRQGWAFFVYASVLTAASDLFSNSLFGVVTSVLVLWIAFQVKYRYS